MWSGELAKITANIKAKYNAAGGGEAGKAAIRALKSRLPAVTLAGTFTHRSNAHWQTPSGLVGIDLDGLDDPAALKRAWGALCDADWIVCLWHSPSGAGLKGAVRVDGLTTDPGQYEQAWRAVSRWLASIGLENDPATKDPARLAFLCHDPEAWSEI